MSKAGIRRLVTPECLPDATLPRPKAKFRPFETTLIRIDRGDLAALTEASRDCEDSIEAEDKAAAIGFVREIRAMADFWRGQLQ